MFSFLSTGARIENKIISLIEKNGVIIKHGSIQNRLGLYEVKTEQFVVSIDILNDNTTIKFNNLIIAEGSFIKLRNVLDKIERGLPSDIKVAKCIKALLNYK